MQALRFLAILWNSLQTISLLGDLSRNFLLFIFLFAAGLVFKLTS